jgi:hypothetical protein
MSGVLDYSLGAEFIFRIYKHHAVDPSKAWVNTYEVHAKAAGDLNDLAGCGASLVDFEQALSLPTTLFDRWTVGTWVPDSHPYDPQAFFVGELDQESGTRDAEPPSGDELGLRVALSLRRQVQSGRSGKVFVRNMLTEADVQGPSGEETLTAPAGISAEVSAAITAAGLGGYMGALFDLQLAMIGLNKEGTKFTRFVTDISAHGVAFVSTNHRWFNRTVLPKIYERVGGEVLVPIVAPPV